MVTRFSFNLGNRTVHLMNESRVVVLRFYQASLNADKAVPL